jgi:hypothetical protein
VQLSWSKSLVRKWLNIKTKAQDVQADCDASRGNAVVPPFLIAAFGFRDERFALLICRRRNSFRNIKTCEGMRDLHPGHRIFSPLSAQTGSFTLLLLYGWFPQTGRVV